MIDPDRCIDEDHWGRITGGGSLGEDHWGGSLRLRPAAPNRPEIGRTAAQTRQPPRAFALDQRFERLTPVRISPAGRYNPELLQATRHPARGSCASIASVPKARSCHRLMRISMAMKRRRVPSTTTLCRDVSAAGGYRLSAKSRRLVRSACRRPRAPLGISSPSAFAVLRLMTSSNFVGCSTGISAGSLPAGFCRHIRRRHERGPGH
jgi:hypothetical protein